jgi:hypothetical protein
MIDARPLGAAVAFAIALVAGAEPPRVAHGEADTYAARGVALAWGVLRDARGPDAATVVVRIATDRDVYPLAAAMGVDPFTQARESRLAPTAAGGGIELRVPRARFADFPRTEFLFYDSAAAAQAAEPALVVFYAGVPDTTPEFASGAALDAHLAERIARLGAVSGRRSP